MVLAQKQRYKQVKRIKRPEINPQSYGLKEFREEYSVRATAIPVVTLRGQNYSVSWHCSMNKQVPVLSENADTYTKLWSEGRGKWTCVCVLQAQDCNHPEVSGRNVASVIWAPNPWEHKQMSLELASCVGEPKDRCQHSRSRVQCGMFWDCWLPYLLSTA